MIANKRFLSMLGEPGAPADVPAEFRLLASSFKRVENCVFFRERALDLDHLSRPITDTEYEAAVNAIRLAKYAEPERLTSTTDLARVAVACAEYLAERLRAFSDEPFRVIISVRERSAMLRFHMIRDGESWLAADLDLEAYEDEGLAIVDSR